MTFDFHHLFGSDGICGTPGLYPLTDGMIYKIGSSIARFLQHKNRRMNHLEAIIARDTESGHRMEVVLTDALCSHNINVYLAGTISTPGLAYIIKQRSEDIGIMISSAHGHLTENGIKLYTENGKLSIEEEQWVERRVFNNLISTWGEEEYQLHSRGGVAHLMEGQNAYKEFLISLMPKNTLKGVAVALHCRSLSLAYFVQKVYESLGAKVVLDHQYVNTVRKEAVYNPELLSQLVLKTRAHIGVALDGDGDKVILADERGAIIDGDGILAILAKYYLECGKLAHNGIVASIMSNLGLKEYVHKIGGRIEYTQVGDKHIASALRKHQFSLGGEHSGYIIFPEHHSSPDGILAALKVMNVMCACQKPLSEFGRVMVKYPQVIESVSVSQRISFDDIPSVAVKLKYYEKVLGEEGRIILRYSGTGLWARIMVEGKDYKLIKYIAASLAREIDQSIGIKNDPLV